MKGTKMNEKSFTDCILRSLFHSFTCKTLFIIKQSFHKHYFTHCIATHNIFDVMVPWSSLIVLMAVKRSYLYSSRYPTVVGTGYRMQPKLQCSK